MSRKKHGVMSEKLKHKLAEELGFADRLDESGWKNVTTNEVGNMVKRAVELAEQQMVNQEMLEDREQ